MFHDFSRLLGRVSSRWHSWFGQRALRSRPSQSRIRLGVELLEDRVVPAFNLAIGSTPTIDVMQSEVSNVCTFTALGNDALLNAG